MTSSLRTPRDAHPHSRAPRTPQRNVVPTPKPLARSTEHLFPAFPETRIFATGKSGAVPAYEGQRSLIGCASLPFAVVRTKASSELARK
ncbi:hypothetical protein PSPO01_01453 [Paraphaeosphaeria sporulosa]